MKKLIILSLVFLLMFPQSFANGIDILPTMQSKTNIQDRVWVGTFQLVWNDLMDKVVHDIVKFPQGTPTMVNELNRQEFTIDDLSEKCYWQYTGKVTKRTKKTIIKTLKNKFKETSDIVNKLNLTPDKRKILIYSILKKDFKFTHTFDILGISSFNGTNAEFFGISQKSKPEIRSCIKVLFYNSPDDFAVVLDTYGKDEVFLYKTATTKTFNYIYADMLKKQKFYKGETKFTNSDELKVPNLKFFEEKSYNELSGKRIKGTQLVIDQALETVKFEMNNTGVKLKSEAAMNIMKMSLEPIFEPRYFYFDETFVLFLKEKNKNNPYFALRVFDISNFQ